MPPDSSKSKQKPLSREELTKKLKATRKKLRTVEQQLATSAADNEVLEKRVSKLDQTQNTLMHNLRRIMRQLGLKPEFPERPEH